MQLPRLYRRGVVRPLNEDADRQLASWSARGSIRAEWLAICGNGDFAEIWQSGILQRINEACDLRISDYEEEALPVEKIPAALEALESVSTRSSTLSARFLANLREMLTEAIRERMPLYFVF
ncbi:MAG: hypothetical protein RL885_24830 [Planctomycetota bacterium]